MRTTSAHVRGGDGRDIALRRACDGARNGDLIMVGNVDFSYFEESAMAAELLEALKYAAPRCTFPHGYVLVVASYGNDISDEMKVKFEKELEGKFELAAA